MRLVVVGGDAAGMTAASLVNRRRDDAEIVVIERGPYTSYSMCGIPYYVAGAIDEPEELVSRSPDEFRDTGMTVHMRTEAMAIDAQARTVAVCDLDRGVERTESYDALLCATGAHPMVPDLPGLAAHGYVVHTLDEGEQLRRALERRDDVRTVAIVGAGYIGLEIAEALIERGNAVHLIDRSPHVMRTLDEDMAQRLEEILTDFGVQLHLGEDLQEIRHDERRCRQVVTDAGCYEADAVVLAMGGKPNVGLAEAAGCAVGESGALVVDERMRTTVPGIWAAGDVVESVDLVADRRINVQLGTHANKQGKVAGIDIAAQPDDGDATFPGLVGTAVTRLCRWDVARTGLTEREATDAGIAYAAVSFTGTAVAGYMPDPGTVHVKMLAERDTGRVLGAQLLGTGNVAKRIDVAAVWCQLGVAVQDAQFLDLSYAPPFGGVWDLLLVAARKLTTELDLSPQL
ncbi:MAG: FAD-dependent oxidoreductase [Actinobacteria bacterium]|nr:FAD-dependent oxidoreductase [Actinomycetota bacterium]